MALGRTSHLAAVAAAAVMSLGGNAQAFGARDHSYQAAVERPRYDGLGREKKRRKVTPYKGNRESARQWMLDAIRAERANGDQRPDVYLHSHARAMRRFKWALDNPGKPLPKAWTEWPPKRREVA